MKIEKVIISRTIPTGPYMNDKIGIEASLEPGESESEVLAILSKKIDSWHRQANPHLYQESSEFTPIYKGGTIDKPNTNGPIPIISKDKERIEIAIDNAETIDDLRNVKAKYDLMPASLLKSYNKKMAELSSERPKNFTEGLE